MGSKPLTIVMPQPQVLNQQPNIYDVIVTSHRSLISNSSNISICVTAEEVNR